MNSKDWGFEVHITVTENGIRSEIEMAVTELEEAERIHFPSIELRTEFIEDCVGCVMYDYEMHEYDLRVYTPNYIMVVLDTAKLYGYTEE